MNIVDDDKLLDFYSRQVRVYGLDIMLKLSRTRVLLVGLKGAGVEIAKNLILSGLAAVTLYDDVAVDSRDLGANFFLTDSEVGKPRSCCAGRLSELNPLVDVRVHTGKLFEELVIAHDVMVMTGGSREQLIKWNDFCRTNKKKHVKFIASASFGAMAYVFTDFGDSFTVERDESTFVQQQHRSLEAALQQPVAAGDAGLLALDVEKSKKVWWYAMLHVLKQALWEFEEKYQRLPTPNDVKEADEVVEIARRFVTASSPCTALFENVNEALASLRLLARSAAVELQPIACLIGGITACEVVKCCGRFAPLGQWLHFDAIEVLPTEVPKDAKPLQSRDDNMILLLGSAVQRRLHASKIFMVGCGALGCEHLKNFAMLGLATEGSITVTDGGRVENADLNRQFLFRSGDIGSSKSGTAAASVRALNPSVKISHHDLLAMTSTTKVFDDDFWTGTGEVNEGGKPRGVGAGDGLTFIIDAAESRPTMKFLDARCLLYQRPLIHSGTDGVAFHSSLSVPCEFGLPSCQQGGDPHAVGHAPSTFDHCVEWARGQFETLFCDTVKRLEVYLKAPDQFERDLRSEVMTFMMDPDEVTAVIQDFRNAEGEGLLSSVERAYNGHKEGFPACVRQAFQIFVDRFDYKIRDLTSSLPQGKSFWSPPRRFPATVEFDQNDPMMTDFLIATANLLAVACGLQQVPQRGKHAGEVDTVPSGHEWRSAGTVLDALKGFEPETWTFRRTKVDEDSDDEDDEGDGMSNFGLVINFLNVLIGFDARGLQAHPMKFDKDRDANFHVDFVCAAANLRARNFNIRPRTRAEVKMAISKIRPSVITSAACASALASLEILKLVQRGPMSSFRNSRINLASNHFEICPSRA